MLNIIIIYLFIFKQILFTLSVKTQNISIISWFYSGVSNLQLSCSEHKEQFKSTNNLLVCSIFTQESHTLIPHCFFFSVFFFSIWSCFTSVNSGLNGYKRQMRFVPKTEKSNEINNCYNSMSTFIFSVFHPIVLQEFHLKADLYKSHFTHLC